MTQSELDDYHNSDSSGYKDEKTLRKLYWEKGLSLQQIADSFDVSDQTILRWMRINDIERRSHTERSETDTASYYVDKPAGHEMWTVGSNGKQIAVHRLLAVAEYGLDSIRGKDIHHKNGIPWDNRPSNIEPLSRSEHMSEHHTGERHPSAKLSAEDVLKIKRMLKSTDKTQAEIGDIFGVSRGAIKSINIGKTWEHIDCRK